MTIDPLAQRLVEKFDHAASSYSGYSIRHGIAAVLRHLADEVLNHSANTLVDRALAGDADAARQFLHEAGFTDQHGQWLPQYQPLPSLYQPTPKATNV